LPIFSEFDGNVYGRRVYEEMASLLSKGNLVRKHLLVRPARKETMKINRRDFVKKAGVLAAGTLMAKAAHSDNAVEGSMTLSIGIDWPAFMKRHDMAWKRLPENWKQAPHFGNAMIGSMLYRAGDSVRLQIFRADVHDHRDNSYGWTAYSRPRFQIGSFDLKPTGKLMECDWRKDLWNAELRGTIRTDKGEIRIRHFVHAEDMAIVTELRPSAGEAECRWSWHAARATTTRPGYPRKAEDIEGFARKYGDHYRTSLELHRPNPEGRLEQDGRISCWVQDLLSGGQYATAWTELKQDEGHRIHLATITNGYPEKTARNEALKNIRQFRQLDMDAWKKTHRLWWHHFYQKSFVSIPEKSLETLYWRTIYRLGCTARTGRSYIDTPGLWFQGGGWPYTTTDWNIQASHWPVYAANRLEMGQELVDLLHANRENLYKSVLPTEWQADSAFLNVTVARDLIGPRNQDKRYYQLVGCLPWTMHNCWLQYRYSMDDDMLRNKVFPLLKRSICLYLHMLREDDKGKLHLQPTYSPETGVWQDCNFDLALLRWGCLTLLKSCERLNIRDPLIPRWKDTLDRLVDFPTDKNGFMLGSNKTAPSNHRHASHLLMIYPLYLVTIETSGTAKVLEQSTNHFNATPGLPAMVAAHGGPMAAAIGKGDSALAALKRLQADLHPNGMWYSPPCLEESLAAANIVQEMLIQSWGDTIRVFPAAPDAWPDIVFHDLRTEGAFLISAVRKEGKTQFVRVKSLAGEPCRIRPGLDGKIQVTGNRTFVLKELNLGIVALDIKKGEEAILWSADSIPEPKIAPVRGLYRVTSV